MIARITRTLLALQLLATLGIAELATHRLHFHPITALLLGLLTVLALRMLITANNFFLAWRYRSPTPPAHRLNWRQACRLFLGEFKATMTASSWTMPFRGFTKRAARLPAALPVLLIHGYGCNSGYWHSMSKALVRANISHYGIDLEPVAAGIDDYVPMINAAIQRICLETGSAQVILVAHSMGGLAARAYLRRHGSDRVAKIITLGTPHRGTGLARFGIGLNTAQMRWIVENEEGLCSEWLRKLEEQEDTSSHWLFVSLYSHQDNIISPQTSSHLAGAKNIAFHGIGHVALGSHPAVQAQVIREILAATASPIS